MYMCSKCFDLLSSKYDKCKNCDYENNEESNIEVDSKLAFQISILNKKGYKTKFSCSGHALEYFITTYIYFEDKINTCPKEWYFDDDGYIIRGNNVNNWFELDFITKENILTKYNYNLLKWALELKPKENIKVYSVYELIDIRSNILLKIDDISKKYKKSYEELYKEYEYDELDYNSEIYKYFKDIDNIDNILYLSSAIKFKDDFLVITEIGKKYNIPYTFNSDINK